MKNLQIIGQSLERWTSTCGLSFSLIDESGAALCQTGGSALPEKAFAEQFWNAEEDQATAAGNMLFHIKDDGETIGLLAVSGPEDQAGAIGPLAVCQVESLLSAASGRNDRTQFLQDALLGHLTDRELDRQAHKAHIQTAALRVVLLIETSQPMDTGIHSIIRTVMGKRTRDYLIPMSERTCVVLQELDEKDGLDETDNIAHMLVGALNTEAMVTARISYSNPFQNLSQASKAHQEAISALEIGRIFNAERHVSGYARLGIGRLIYQLPRDICEMFVDEILCSESLEDLDSETLHIIRTFFDNDLNLSETSRQLYVHRNSLVYRFEKLEKKYGLDLRRFEDALSFKLAMLVSDYLLYLRGKDSP